MFLCDLLIFVVCSHTASTLLKFSQIINHSPYYDFKKLSMNLNSYKNKFSIFSTNIQSINAKIDELRIFIECLKRIKYTFSAICIQESWLSEDNDTSQIQLECYNCILQGKSCCSKARLIISLHEKFKHVHRLKLNKYATWGGQVKEVKKGDILAKPIYIGNIYRPPKENVEFYNEFINEFSPILESFEMNNKEVIITGDFNIDLLKVNDKHITSEYFDMLTSYSFYPKITVPTRLTNNHGTLIDNFPCKLTESSLDITAGVLIKRFSDHQPYFILLNNVQIRDSHPVFVKVTKQDNESRHHFYN